MDFLPHTVEVAGPNAEPDKVGLVVHGILGSGTNWRSFIRKLVETDPEAARIRWLLVDLRHHGDSGAGQPPDTVESCGRDLAALCESKGVRPLLSLGHSFGGKVVLSHAHTALEEKTGIPKLVAFLDTPLAIERMGRASRSGDEIGEVIHALSDLKPPFVSRAAVAEALMSRGFSNGLAQWMTTNVKPSPEGGYVWRFNLEGVRALLADYFELDGWQLVSQIAPHCLVRGILGERSNRFSDEERVRLAASSLLAVETLPQAGHWLHVDNPDGLREMVGAFVREALAP